MTEKRTRYFGSALIGFLAGALVLTLGTMRATGQQQDDLTEFSGELVLDPPPHSASFCTCGVLLDGCDCATCATKGHEQKMTYHEACTLCAHRSLAKMVGTVLELGVRDIAASQGDLLLKMRANAVAVPLAHLQGVVRQAEALNLAEDATVGLVLHCVDPLTPGQTDFRLGERPDGAADVAFGTCYDCGDAKLLNGPYCIACGLAHQGEQRG